MSGFEDWSEEDLLLFLKESEAKGNRILNALTNHLSLARKARKELSDRLKQNSNNDMSLMYGNEPVTVTTVGISYTDKGGNNQSINIDVARVRRLPTIPNSNVTESITKLIRETVKS